MPSPSASSSNALQTAAGLIASGRAKDAARELNALVREAPTYAAAYVLLAKAREASGDRVRALDAWHRAYFLVPSSPLVRRERQRLLDALAPPEPETPHAARPNFAPADSSPTPDETIASAEADLLPPLDAPDEAEPEADVPEDDWSVVDEGDAFPPPAPPSRPIAPDLVPPGEDLRAYHDALPETDDIADAFEITGEAKARGLDDDLDSLIRDLEDAPRIRPNPEYDGPEETGTQVNVEDMVSETLVWVYAKQQKYPEAADVLEKLARQSPDRAAEYRQRAEEMRQRAT
ncbi:MAG: hypothetical protein AAGI52_03835 [Bacteroidota bacterium]